MELHSIFVLLAVTAVYFLYLLLEYHLLLQFILIVILSQVALWIYFALATTKRKLQGKVVLITGAGDGVGKQLAYQFAELDTKLVLWDIRKELLDQLESGLKVNGRECCTFVCDVSDREMVYSTAFQVKQKFGKVDILINNAGIVAGRNFLEIDDDEIQRVVDVNLMAHFWTVKAFLKDMTSQNSGHIVNVASVAGMVAMNGVAEYSASKFGAYGFAEALRRECLNTSVKVITICPWIIDTELFKGVKDLLFIPKLKASYVASRIIQAVQCDETVVVLPGIFHLLPLTRLMPPTIVDFIATVTGATKSISTFRGRGREWNMFKISSSKKEQ